MNKNIVICIDGTGNEPDDVQEEGRSTTNVYRLYEALNEGITMSMKTMSGWCLPQRSTASSAVDASQTTSKTDVLSER